MILSTILHGIIHPGQWHGTGDGDTVAGIHLTLAGAGDIHPITAIGIVPTMQVTMAAGVIHIIPDGMATVTTGTQIPMITVTEEGHPDPAVYITVEAAEE